MLNNNYVPLHVHSFYSLCDGLASPTQIARRAKDLGCPAVAITDHGGISGIVEFDTACRKLGIKPIFGIELYVCRHDATIKSKDNGKPYHHLTLLSTTQDSLQRLMAIVSAANREEHFYHKPRLDLDRLAEFVGPDSGILCLSGCIAGELSASLFENLNDACSTGQLDGATIDHVSKLLKPDWRDISARIVERYVKVFGNNNYMIELQTEGMLAQDVCVGCLREAAKALQIKSVATQDAHYCLTTDAVDQRILLYAQMHTTADEQDRLKAEGGDTMAFFHMDTFHIPTLGEMQKTYTPAEIEATLEIADRVQSPKLGRPPMLPRTANSDATLYSLCIEGAKVLLAGKTPDEKATYWKRLQYEIAVIKDAKLADYFLIVRDACKYVDGLKLPRGAGRGSGAGSLVNYLLDITKIDPLLYGLYFERFYNASRNVPPHFNAGSMPFLEWLEKEFEATLTADMSVYKETVRQRVVKDRMGALLAQAFEMPDRIRAEADWIDAHSPKMWMYLAQLPESCEENSSNSTIAYAIGTVGSLPAGELKTETGGVSLPDIDIDIGVYARDLLITYLTGKWGSDKTCQIATFGRLQGKAALKEVFRTQPDFVRHLTKVRIAKENGDIDAEMARPMDICNEITKEIPDEAAIADDLQKMAEESGDEDYGILRWAVDNVASVKIAYKWYQPLFAQAMRIEGTKRNQSKHAAGIIIADNPIEHYAPMAYDVRTKTRMCALEMAHAEKMGLVKFDFLGVVALDKIWGVQNMVNARAEIAT